MIQRPVSVLGSALLSLRSFKHNTAQGYIQARTFSTSKMASAPSAREWLVIVRDHGGMLEKRMEVRPYVDFVLIIIDTAQCVK